MKNSVSPEVLDRPKPEKKDFSVDPSKWALIESIDFSMIKRKLFSQMKNQGWTMKKIERSVSLYKMWLYLKLHDSKMAIVPSKTIDAVWHQHILDTRGYHNDCQRVFGYFLHHFPYFGMRGPEDKLNLIASYKKTQQLFKKIWHTELSSKMEYSMCDGEGSCDGSVSA